MAYIWCGLREPEQPRPAHRPTQAGSRQLPVAQSYGSTVEANSARKKPMKEIQLYRRSRQNDTDGTLLAQ
jgi:hypothetical protein